MNMKNELEKRYSTLELEELIKIVNSPKEYNIIFFLT